MLEVLQQYAASNDSIVTFPDVWTNFDAGKLGGSKIQRKFSFKWHQASIFPEPEILLYTSIEQKAIYGKTEKRDKLVVKEAIGYGY